MATDPSAERPPSVRRLAWRLLRISSIGFGGPAVHIGLLHREFVERTSLITPTQFSVGFALASCLPGPNSTQLAMQIAYRIGGARGLLVGGASWILPGVAFVIALSALYAANLDATWMQDLTQVLVPVLVGAIAVALGRFALSLKGRARAVSCAVVAAALVALGANPLLGVLGGALLGWMAHRAVRGLREALDERAPWPPALGLLAGTGAMAALATVVARSELSSATVPLPEVLVLGGAGPGAQLVQLLVLLAWYSATIFGSGYLFISYAEHGLVGAAELVSSEQLLVAVGITEMAPGPLFSVGAALGFMTGGLPSALLASVAVFTPAFLFSYLAARLAEQITDVQRWAAVASALGGSAVGAIAMTFASVVGGFADQLGHVALFAVSLLVAAVTRVPPPVLLLGGALLWGLSRLVW